MIGTDVGPGDNNECWMKKCFRAKLKSGQSVAGIVFIVRHSFEMSPLKVWNFLHILCKEVRLSKIMVQSSKLGKF